MAEVPDFVKSQAASSLDLSSLKGNPTNPKPAKEEKEETEHRVSAPVAKAKEAHEAKKVLGIFSKGDLKEIKDYVWYEVVKPSILDTVSSVVSNSVDMLLFGETRSHGRRSNGSDRRTYTSYNSMYRSDRDRDRDRDRRDYREERVHSNEPRELVFESRKEAEDVLGGMSDILDDYKTVSVADMYDLVGITGSFTDNNWGWDDLRTARVIRCRDGYTIDLPRTISLK